LLRTISSFTDAITNRICDLIFLEIGKPPVPFAFVVLGSEGREEQSLHSDQDNAIIFKDVADNQNAEVENYFIRFAERMNYSLNAIGYPYCKGEKMAKNPLWNKPISIWKKYFFEWITNPEPKNLLEISVFFDMKLTFGDTKLLD